MLGLPKATELNKQLPKKAIYAKFSMNTSAKDKFDADISRITIVNEISPNTVKTITATEDVPSFYVLLVSLKRKDYEERTIAQISRLINQNMLLVLEYQDECRLAIYHTKLIQSEWQKTDSCTITLRGLDLAAVWQNVVMQVGSIEIEEGHSLEQQIVVDERRAKVQAEIDKLEKLARKETQPKKKFELVQRIQQMRNDLEA